MTGTSQFSAFLPKDVTLCDDFLCGIAQKDVDFLNSFDPDRLLSNFRVTAGLPNKNSAISYSGWENSRIGGHTLGHYLSAAAQAVARGYGSKKGKDNITLKDRLDYLIKSLYECQENLKTGFIFGATLENPACPELQFDKLEKGDYNGIWVPWYTLHKILSGLIQTYSQTGNKTALTVAQRLGEWVYRRTKNWTEEMKKNSLRVEYGGMNDCLYELYKCARQENFPDAEHFLKAAHCFDDVYLFSHIEIVSNQHANTTIPKFIGALNRYDALLKDGIQESDYLGYAENFWDFVINHHTYITGGNSECEHFGEPDILDAERSNTNCETCNTYNMLKLSRMLFMHTKNKKYSDYYENTFINAILASVNPTNGMTTYFQPMATGCFKTFCNPDVNKNYFWCCTGTGMENFTKLDDSIYFCTKDTVAVNLYISSKVRFNTVEIHQNSTLPFSDTANFIIHTKEKTEFTLALRLPDWLPHFSKDSPSYKISVNQDTAQQPAIKNGYALIKRTWQEGDSVQITLPMTFSAKALPDNKKAIAFKYGPVVLAAELGTDNQMTVRQVGTQCDVSGNKIVGKDKMELFGNYGGTSGLKILKTEILLLKNQTRDNLIKNPQLFFNKTSKPLTFTLQGTASPALTFSPYYLINNQRYGIYWIFTENKAEFLQEQLKAYQENSDETFTEGIGVGYGAQTEGNSEQYPFFKEEGSGSTPDAHNLTRYANKGGSFSYMIKIQKSKKNSIVCVLTPEDAGKTILVKADGITIASLTVTKKDKGPVYEEKIPLPDELNQKESVRVSFEGNNKEESARLCAPLKSVYAN